MKKEERISYPRVIDEITIGPPYLTKYEKARIIAARLFQLFLNAPPLINPEKIGSRNMYEIAKEEVERGILPVAIYRKAPEEAQSISLRLLLETGEKLIGRKTI
ncbi:MAG: DNA-directed RNA polymerase subunit K [Desulfurococcales archaeon]|nr:DNA-directed RNA polymerase subunit K [Desulfurococcales archaeon]